MLALRRQAVRVERLDAHSYRLLSDGRHMDDDTSGRNKPHDGPHEKDA